MGLKGDLVSLSCLESERTNERALRVLLRLPGWEEMVWERDEQDEVQEGKGRLTPSQQPRLELSGGGSKARRKLGSLRSHGASGDGPSMCPEAGASTQKCLWHQDKVGQSAQQPGHRSAFRPPKTQQANQKPCGLLCRDLSGYSSPGPELSTE